MDVFRFVNEIIDPQKMWERKVIEKLSVSKDVPKEYVTREMCKHVFSRSSRYIEYILSEYISKEMCLKAINDDVSLVDHVHERFLGADDIDPEIDELIRCKSGNGECKETYYS